MALDPKLLDLLCCPISHKPLKPASKTMLERLQKQHASFRNVDEALVTLDERRAYPVQDGIPVLLPEAAIELQA